ncbi:unnamed protein product [Plutella xylostella]|uniref:(diamondback moth) hypothetical protein n=1 Tax=Plutella xylostella TaxID=51655 RepID=A0A8S4FE07_PLUXY|nr:uncharacterized protein LOC105390921 [Plutella xylostella]CAG9126075.1 unnamed protein product [Plutella xylostella]
MSSYAFKSEDLIEEVRKRPGLWDNFQSIDRIAKLVLWKEVGQVLFRDWDTINKATAYDRVLQIQKKWRSLKDAYNRELRCRKRGIRVNRRVYVYFKKLTFLGGFEDLPEPAKEPFEESDDDVDKNSIEHEDNGHDTLADGHHSEDPLQKVVRKEKKVKNKKKAVKRRKKVYIEDKQDSDEMPVYLEDIEDEENDSDKLFLLSFYPELKKLPPNIKMWARAQIANIMEEAVTSHFNNSTTTMLPVSAGFEGHSSRMDFKRPMRSSSEISDVIM